MRKYKLIFFTGEKKSLYLLYFELAKAGVFSIGHGGQWSPRHGYGIDEEHLSSVSAGIPLDRFEEIEKIWLKYEDVKIDPCIAPVEFGVN